MFAKSLKKAWNIVTDPISEFKKLNKISFEKVLGEYLHMLITIGIIAGIFNLLINVFRALYLDIFLHADVQYIRMINYLFGKASSIFFFALFFGTFIMFLVSLIIKQFFTRVKYTEMLKILFYSLTPLLLFGWTHKLVPGLVIWSLIMLYHGMKVNESNIIKSKTKKNSIKQRE